MGLAAFSLEFHSAPLVNFLPMSLDIGQEMTLPPLTRQEMEGIVLVLRRHPAVDKAVLFGPRAEGTRTPGADVDLALWGDQRALRPEAIAAELAKLPWLYRFYVVDFERIKWARVREYIQRVGITVYRKRQP